MQGDYAPVVVLGRRHARARCVHLHARTTDTSQISTSTPSMFSTAALGFIALGPDHRPAPRGYRPVGRTARRLPGGGRLVLRRTTTSLRRCGYSGFVVMFAAAAATGRGERVTDQIRQVHPGGRDADDVHRAARVQLPAARRTRAASSSRRSPTRSRPRSARCRSSSSCSSSPPWRWSSPCAVRRGATGCAPSDRTRSRPARSA